MTHTMKSVYTLRRILFLQNKSNLSFSQNADHHDTFNDHIESVVSMKCNCRRIPLITFTFCAIFCLILGNISLSIQFNNISSLNSFDLPKNYVSKTIEDKTISEILAKSTVETLYHIPIQSIRSLNSINLHKNSVNKTNENKTISLEQSSEINLSLSPASSIHDNNDQTKNQTEILVTPTVETLHHIPIPSIQRSKRRKNWRSSRRTGRRPLEPMEPTKDSLSSDATFAACLLIKDDNDILSEWIAYHFHAMRMRYLIVSVDPLSSESPESILESWSNYTDLEIVLWNDSNFMPHDFLQHNVPPKEYVLTVDDLTNVADSKDENLQNKKVMLEISNHRYRQGIFLSSCMKHVRDVNRTWVMHIDTDEYIVPSKLLRQMNSDYVTVQDMSISGSVLNLIQQVVHKTGSLVNYPCISMQRVLFGSQEIPTSEMIVNEGSLTDHMFNRENFETLRWRYHALPSDQFLHGSNPKVILDVAAITSKFFNNPQRPVYSIHRPVPEYCPKNYELEYSNFQKHPLDVNHYIGSWERYSGRNDKRRSKIVYDKKVEAAKRGRDDGMQTWLLGFVNDIGIDIAKLLLKQYIKEPTEEIRSISLDNVTL